jgi:hypothetical protein
MYFITLTCRCCLTGLSPPEMTSLSLNERHVLQVPTYSAISKVPCIHSLYSVKNLPHQKKNIGPKFQILMRFIFHIAHLTISTMRRPSSISDQIMWDSRRTNWHWGMISMSSSVSPANFHSSSYFIFIDHTVIDDTWSRHWNVVK